MSKRLLVAAVLALFVAACSTQTKELPTIAPKDAAPAPAAAPTAAAPSPTPQTGLPPPQTPEEVRAQLNKTKLPDYQGEVKINMVEGNMTYLGILSKYACTTDDQCTSTKYANAPATKGDCTCQTPCTPYVATKTEAAKREASNKKLCGVDDWFGIGCPAPNCSFIDFIKFKCYEGKCAGVAMGKN